MNMTRIKPIKIDETKYLSSVHCHLHLPNGKIINESYHLLKGDEINKFNVYRIVNGQDQFVSGFLKPYNKELKYWLFKLDGQKFVDFIRYEWIKYRKRIKYNLKKRDNFKGKENV